MVEYTYATVPHINSKKIFLMYRNKSTIEIHDLRNFAQFEICPHIYEIVEEDLFKLRQDLFKL